MKPKIRAALRQTKGTHEYARVVAVNMVRIKELDASFTADVLSVDRGTVSKWLDAYDRYGLDGLPTPRGRAAPLSCRATN